jgi:hypothetical protein
METGLFAKRSQKIYMFLKGVRTRMLVGSQTSIVRWATLDKDGSSNAYNAACVHYPARLIIGKRGCRRGLQRIPLAFRKWVDARVSKPVCGMGSNVPEVVRWCVCSRVE